MSAPSDEFDSSVKVKSDDAVLQEDAKISSESKIEDISKITEETVSCVTDSISSAADALIKEEQGNNEQKKEDTNTVSSSDDVICKSKENTADASLNVDNNKSPSAESNSVCDNKNVVERDTKVKVKIKKGDLSTIDYELCLNDTVAELKQKLVSIVDIPAEYQRIVTSGGVLKNDCTIQSLGIIKDQIIFVLNNSPENLAPKNEQPAAKTASIAASSGSTTAFSTPSISITAAPISSSTINSSSSYLSANAFPSATPPYPNLRTNPINIFGGSLPTMNSAINQDMVSQLLNGPFMKDIMDNPNFLSYLLEANPQLNELRRRNPELNHILNDPQMLRQCMELMRNPSLMREMMRSSDRAMSNMEAMPGGFNALLQVYHTIQEPMWNATVDGNPLTNPPSTQKTSMYELKTDEPPNTEALPNPWAPESTVSTNNENPSTANPISNVRIPSNVMAPNNQTMPLMGFDNNNFASLLSNPFIQNFINQNLSGNNGANIQSSSSASQSFASSGAFSSVIPPTVSSMQLSNSLSSMTNSNDSQNFVGRDNSLFELPAMMNAMHNMSLNGRLPNLPQEPPRSSNDNPEFLYHSQLYALRNMGFTDTQACIRALREANGNINSAIDRLLSGSNNS